jgi:hypothetical protein
METIWREVEGGRVETVIDSSEEMGVPSVLIAEQPDWLKLPEELGGDQVRVQSLVTYKLKCPKCQQYGEKQVLILERDLNVLACPVCKQYIWFK